MHQPIEWRAKKTLAQRQRAVQPGSEELFVYARTGVSRPQTCRNQRMRIETRDADAAAMGIEHAHQTAWRQRLRRLVEFQFVRVYPRVTTLNAAFLARFHAQSGQRRSAEHTSELQSLMRISYAVFCLQTKIKTEQSHI